MILYTADWVLPVDGAPIEEGGVAVEGGRIVGVGPADELDGERRDFRDAVIVPGLVNAHTHLEYAVYAGFGDGLAFGPWLHTHIERKARIGWNEFVAIARLGAAECLASGVTTIGDASFSGAAAVAAAELGLGATVYLEVFGSDPSHADELRARIETLERDVGPSVLLGVSPHAPYSVSAEVYSASYALDRPVATHVAESDDERDYMLTGEGPIAAVSDVTPPGTTSVRRSFRTSSISKTSAVAATMTAAAPASVSVTPTLSAAGPATAAPSGMKNRPQNSRPRRTRTMSGPSNFALGRS